VSAMLEEERGEIEMTAFAGLSVELGQRQFDLGMPGSGHTPSGTEAAMQIVDEAPGDREQPVVAGGAAIRDRRLDQVATAVELVAMREVGPSLVWFGHCVVRVEVAVGALSRRDQIDHFAARRLQGWARHTRHLARGGLEPFVDV